MQTLRGLNIAVHLRSATKLRRKSESICTSVYMGYIQGLP